MLQILKPEKQKDFYFAPISRSDGKKYKLRLSGSQIISIHALENGGKLLKLWIPPDNELHSTMRELDQEVFQHTLQKNQEWFPNALSEDQIKDFFRSSIHSQYSSLSVLLSQWKPPIIFEDGNVIESLDISKDYKNMRVQVELEADGICFFRHRFGLRWIVRQLWLKTPLEENDSGEDWMDRQEIHEQWQSELEKFKERIAADKTTLTEKIQQLSKLEEFIENKLQMTKDFPDNLWHQEIEQISKIMVKYSVGIYPEFYLP